MGGNSIIGNTMIEEVYSNSSHGVKQWSKAVKASLACKVWHAWRHPWRQQDGVYGIGSALEHLGQRAIYQGIENIALGPGQASISDRDSSLVLEASKPSAFLIAHTYSDTSLFKSQCPKIRAQPSWRRAWKVTYLTWHQQGPWLSTAFHKPLARSHAPIRHMDSAVLREYRVTGWTTDFSLPPPLTPTGFSVNQTLNCTLSTRVSLSREHVWR